MRKEVGDSWGCRVRVVGMLEVGVSGGGDWVDWEEEGGEVLREVEEVRFRRRVENTLMLTGLRSTSTSYLTLSNYF